MKTLMLFAKLKSRKIYFIFPKIYSLFLTVLLVIILFVFSVQNLSAQNLIEYSSLINSMNETKQMSALSNAEHLRSLVYDLNSKLYINNQIENAVGITNPVCVKIDAQSIDKLYEENQLFNQVELITINLNDLNELNFFLDLSKLKSFTNLKYIQFLCSFKCDPLLINNLYQKISNTDIIVFYQISIPE
jgi:hypothetical protein